MLFIEIVSNLTSLKKTLHDLGVNRQNYHILNALYFIMYAKYRTAERSHS